MKIPEFKMTTGLVKGVTRIFWLQWYWLVACGVLLGWLIEMVISGADVIPMFIVGMSFGFALMRIPMVTAQCLYMHSIEAKTRELEEIHAWRDHVGKIQDPEAHRLMSEAYDAAVYACENAERVFASVVSSHETPTQG